MYKVIFARNTIVSCQLVAKKAEFEGKYHCEYDRGFPIYAMMNVASEEEALAVARNIMRKAAETLP